MGKLLVGDVFNNLVDLLLKANVIVALVLAAVGITLAVVAKRVAFAIKKTKNIEEAEQTILLIKSVGLVLIIVALILIIL